MSSDYEAELPELSRKGKKDIEDDFAAWNTFTMNELVGVHQFEWGLVRLVGGDKPSLDELYRKRTSRIGRRIIPMARRRNEK